MNIVGLIGRLTTDPELRYIGNDKAYTRFTLAVNRSYKNENGKIDADFISVVAWNKDAETICNYVKKGNRLGVTGRIQTGSYEKADGSRGYQTDVILNKYIFLESKPKEDRPAPDYNETTSIANDDPFADFGESIEITDNDLPF